MKTYIAERTSDGVLVTVCCTVFKHRLYPGASQNVYNHSPDGFEWGYAGSGPAQLALAILLDYLCDRERALAFYQAFKFAKIATAPREGFRISGDEIDEWLAQATKPPVTDSSGGDFTTSAVVGYVTGSALFGELAGGSLIGGLVGSDLSATSEATPAPMQPENQDSPANSIGDPIQSLDNDDS